VREGEGGGRRERKKEEEGEKLHRDKTKETDIRIGKTREARKEKIESKGIENLMLTQNSW
jgi:hypothetical protein